jgi:hypothetical protein
VLSGYDPTVLIAYLDEFGHIGPFISGAHKKFNDHPVFGFGGFVMPAENVRAFGGYFEYLKERLLAYEIQRDQAHARRWEKKGASLLRTQNIEKYGSEIRPVLSRLERKLKALGGRLFFYGQVKPIGSAKETGESSSQRSSHALRQAILRLSQYAESLDETILICTDSVDQGPRLDAVMASASFIYGAHTPALKRVIEIPMQLESHYYGTTQYADWVCAMLSRSTHALLVEGSEFTWAPALLRNSGARLFTDNSKIRRIDGARDLFREDVCKAARAPKPLANKGVRTITQRIGATNPALAAFRDSLGD